VSPLISPVEGREGYPRKKRLGGKYSRKSYRNSNQLKKEEGDHLPLKNEITSFFLSCQKSRGSMRGGAEA